MPVRRSRSFAPVVAPGARILILGSMPGQASLAARQYYAHPQNQFWPIIEALLGVPRSLPYPDRLQGLTSQGVALWDVLQSCVRSGSLDASIEQATAVPNAVTELIRSYPHIERIACNGAAAWQAVQRHFGEELRRDFPRVCCLKLPSTSPAHAGMTRAAKLERWRAALRDA